MFCRKCGKSIDDESTFCRFCGTEVVETVKETRIEREYRQNNELLDKAKELMNNNNFEEAREILLDLSGFRNADELAERCLTGAFDYRRRTTYEHAKSVLNNDGAKESELLLAAEDFETLGEYEDAQELAVQCRNKANEILKNFEKAYIYARELLNGSKTSSGILFACEELEKLGDYKDCAELVRKGRIQLDKYYRYKNAVECLNNAKSVHQLMDVIESFRALGDFLDSEEMCSKAFEKVYAEAVDNSNACDDAEKQDYAAYTFEAIKTYKDAEQRAQECRKRSEELNAEMREKARRKAEEADELELQYCKDILGKPNAKIAEVKEAEGRLLLIKKHSGVEEALAECNEKLLVLRKKHTHKIIIGNIVVCSIIVLVILGVVFSSSILPEIKYSNAQGLAEQGKYSEAADEFESIYQYKDSREMAAKLRAQSCVELGNIEEAASLLKNAGLYDMEKDCLISEFNRLVSEGSTDKAIAFAGQHTELEENRKALCNDILNELLEQGKYDEAIKFCEDNLPNTDDISRCYYQMADSYVSSNNQEKAAESYQKAGDYLDAKAKEKDCYAKIADEYRALEQYYYAILYYNKADMTAKVQECNLELGKKAEESGDYKTAMDNYKKAGSAGSSYRSSLQEETFKRGLALCNSGDYAEAIKLLEISDSRKSNELIKCCKAINNLYNCEYSLDEAYGKLSEVYRSNLNDNDQELQDFAYSLMSLQVFNVGMSFPTVYCYFATFTWKNGDVMTYCISPNELKLGIKFIEGRYSSWDEKDRLARACYSNAESFGTNIYYDPGRGYYILDDGIKVYFHWSGSDLVVDNHGTSILAGTYNEYTYVIACGM